MPVRAFTAWWEGVRRRLQGRQAPPADDGVHLHLEHLIGLRRQATRFHLVPRPASGSPLPGGYRALFRGRGMDFDELREYQPGDDVRSIHWPVTARTGRTHTKTYREERERSIFLLIDLRRSMFFGTRKAFKSVVAARISALLAWAAAEGGDRVGALIFREDGLRLLKPLSGRRGVLRVLKGLVAMHRPSEAEGGGTDFATALHRLGTLMHPGAMLFIVSDFYELDAASQPHLARLARHHDVLGAFVYDPLEAEPPPAGCYPVTDGRATAVIDSEDAGYCRAHRAQFRARNDRVVAAFLRQRSHLLRLSTANTLDESLRRLFDVRERTRQSLRGRGG